MRILFEAQGRFQNLGCNGYQKSLGIEVSRAAWDGHEEVHLEPVNSTGNTGRARLVVPMQHVPELIRALLELPPGQATESGKLLRLREAIALGLTPAEANAVFCENPEWGATEVERTEAERCYTLDSNNDIEIDDCPQVRRSDDGVWVAAWVWLPRLD